MNAKNILRKVSAVLTTAFLAFIFLYDNDILKGEVIHDPISDQYWEMFSGISLKRTYVEEAEAHYRLPVFTPELQALKGEEVSLAGFFLPYSKVDSIIIISRFPIASCFYCGQAGVESVAMVEMVDSPAKPYKTDQRLVVKGKLALNNSDVNKLAFVLTGATVEEAR